MRLGRVIRWVRESQRWRPGVITTWGPPAWPMSRLKESSTATAACTGWPTSISPAARCFRPAAAPTRHSRSSRSPTGSSITSPSARQPARRSSAVMPNRHRPARRVMRADGAAEEPCLAAAWGGVAGQRDIWPTPRQELLLRSALLPDTRALAAWRTIRMQLNPHGLDRATQGLLPAVYRNLASQGVDDQLVSGFRDVHSSVWAWNQRLLHRVLPVVGQLERAGIRTLLIKGAALIADGPFDAGLRTLNDVDVLIPTDQRADAIAVLLERGFRPIGAVPPWYVRDYAPRFVPSHAFADDLNNQIDLHWHVLHSSCQPDADDDFWAAARSIELRSVSTSALSATDELLLVILHGLRWHQVPTYRWVLDAAQLARGAYGPVDFGRLVTQARKRRVTAALRAGLSYLC